MSLILRTATTPSSDLSMILLVASVEIPFSLGIPSPAEF